MLHGLLQALPRSEASMCYMDHSRPRSEASMCYMDNSRQCLGVRLACATWITPGNA